MEHINHILFDLDHTLWDFEANSDIAFATIFQEHSIAVDLDRFLDRYRGINQEYWKLYREERITKTALRYGRLKDTFDLLGYAISDAMIETLSHRYIDVLPHSNRLFDGALEILDHLKQANYTLHVITNGFNEVQFRKIEMSGMAPYFNQVITSEAAGVKKPNPGIFEFALQCIGSSPGECLMIGDNWEADIMGALDYGIDAIHFNSNGETRDSRVKSVAHLLEIKNYL
jgi:putative hydrolase of the HAD superfamily